MLKALVVLALRHYRDPTSWAGILVAVTTAAHWNISPDMANALDGVCAALVGLLLVAADGRKNPNDTGDGAISQRLPAPAPAASGTGPARDDLPAGAGTAVRTTDTLAVRRLGPDHGP